MADADKGCNLEVAAAPPGNSTPIERAGNVGGLLMIRVGPEAADQSAQKKSAKLAGAPGRAGRGFLRNQTNQLLCPT
jgi:hypothetical protein